MLCSRCFEKINQDEEIRTEDSAMICKECAEKATTDCYTCGNKIPQNKHVYESSREWNKKFNVWWIFSSSISGVEKVKQCHNCYQKQIIKEEIFQYTLKILYLCLLTSIASGTFWIFHVFYPDKIKLIENHHYLCTAMFLISVFTSFYIIWSLFSNLFPNSIILKKIKKKKNNSLK